MQYSPDSNMWDKSEICQRHVPNDWKEASPSEDPHLGPGGGWEVIGGAVRIDRHAVHGAHFAGLAASTDLIKISQNHYSIF